MDGAVDDVLRLKFELGLFENPYQTSEAKEQQAMLKPEYRALAREAADKSIVLRRRAEKRPAVRTSLCNRGIWHW